MPDKVREYFGQQVKWDDPYAALNTAFWKGGSFLYVPGACRGPHAVPYLLLDDDAALGGLPADAHCGGEGQYGFFRSSTIFFFRWIGTKMHWRQAR